MLVGARFCQHCGAAREARPAEKRLVTVLFADMSSSVEATRDLHPEDAVSLINVPLELMVDAVLDHGGKVDRFLGDGLLAVWGADRAREDDPQQAIRAALAMRDAARGKGLDVAAGIDDLFVFHAGTGEIDGRYIATGGRVLGVTGRGATVAEAIAKAYEGIRVISWEGVHYRSDIGRKALGR